MRASFSVLLLLVVSFAVGRDLYLSGGGSDTADCTDKQPCKSLSRVVSLCAADAAVDPHCFVGCRGVLSSSGNLNVEAVGLNLTLVGPCRFVGLSGAFFLSLLGGALNMTLVNVTGFGGALETGVGVLRIVGGTSATLSYSNFYGNLASAVVVRGAGTTAHFDHCSFSQNNFASGYGGSLAVRESASVTVMNSAFTGGTAGNGAHVALVQQAIAMFERCHFRMGTARDRGGSFDLDDSAVTILHSSFDSCSTKSYGGALSAYNSVVALRNTSVSSCSASFGGSLWVTGPISTATVEQSSFVSNKGVFGNIYVDGCRLRLTDCEFWRNSVTGTGGVLGAVTGAHVEVQRCRFEDNEARDGGCFYVQYDVELVVSRSLFLYNSVSGEGSVMYCAESIVSFDAGCDVFSNASAHSSLFCPADVNGQTCDVQSDNPAFHCVTNTAGPVPTTNDPSFVIILVSGTAIVVSCVVWIVCICRTLRQRRAGAKDHVDPFSAPENDQSGLHDELVFEEHHNQF